MKINALAALIISFTLSLSPLCAAINTNEITVGALQKDAAARIRLKRIKRAILIGGGSVLVLAAAIGCAAYYRAKKAVPQPGAAVNSTASAIPLCRMSESAPMIEDEVLIYDETRHTPVQPTTGEDHALTTTPPSPQASASSLLLSPATHTASSNLPLYQAVVLSHESDSDASSWNLPNSKRKNLLYTFQPSNRADEKQSIKEMEAAIDEQRVSNEDVISTPARPAASSSNRRSRNSHSTPNPAGYQQSPPLSPSRPQPPDFYGRNPDEGFRRFPRPTQVRRRLSEEMETANTAYSASSPNTHEGDSATADAGHNDQ